MKKYIEDTIKVVLFDHDDTLVRTIEAKWAEHKHIAKKYYGKDLTDDELHKHWGKPLSTMIGLLYGTDDLIQAMDYVKITQNDFPKKLHDDTLATLKHLKKASRKIGVITATTRHSFENDLKTLHIPENLFDYTQTEDDTSFHKPDPRVFKPVLLWLKQEGIKPSEVVYVGDGLHDMKAALGAGFEFIGVSTGLVTQSTFKKNGATAILKLSDLIEEYFVDKIPMKVDL
ncbi:MAG TPA: HAD-IA family hydrolase [Candidatus Saccharimonadales bacterium]|nr:HAD-IA family hydrolase [Candidatus Saccharimonadales bacterium]